jgi:predicted dehydrogenase
MLDLTDALRRRALRRRSGLARSYDEQLHSFVDCVRGRAAASPCLKDGLAVLRAIEAARVSLARGGSAITLTSIT